MGKKMKFPFLFKNPPAKPSAAATAPWQWRTCVTNHRTLSFRSEPQSPESDCRSENPNPDLGIIHLKSDRFFFEPGETSSLLKQSKKNPVPMSIMEMESGDPYLDFRASMAEIIETHELKNDWEFLEELLVWYLKLNCRSNHRYIVNAFIDLVTGDLDENWCCSGSSEMTQCCSLNSPASFSSSGL